jgi:hypothetical protein
MGYLFECVESPPYHTTGDQSTELNFSQMAQVAKVVAAGIAELTMAN